MLGEETDVPWPSTFVVPLQTTALPSGDECPRVVIYFRFHLPWNEYRLTKSERQFRVVNASRPPEEFTALTLGHELIFLLTWAKEVQM